MNVWVALLVLAVSVETLWNDQMQIVLARVMATYRSLRSSASSKFLRKGKRKTALVTITRGTAVARGQVRFENPYV